MIAEATKFFECVQYYHCMLFWKFHTYTLSTFIEIVIFAKRNSPNFTKRRKRPKNWSMIAEATKFPESVEFYHCMIFRKFHWDRLNTFAKFLIFAKKIADFRETNKTFLQNKNHRYRNKIFCKCRILTINDFLKISLG